MNCKPGDLAFIVRSDFPENIGRIVRVVAAHGIRQFQGCAEFMWIVNVDGRPATGSFGDTDGPATKGLICDSFLRPIRPEPELLPAPLQEVTA